MTCACLDVVLKKTSKSALGVGGTLLMVLKSVERYCSALRLETSNTCLAASRLAKISPNRPALTCFSIPLDV